MLDIVLTSRKECVDDVKICEQSGVFITTKLIVSLIQKTEWNRKIRYMKYVHKGSYDDTRKSLA